MEGLQLCSEGRAETELGKLIGLLMAILWVAERQQECEQGAKGLRQEPDGTSTGVVYQN